MIIGALSLARPPEGLSHGVACGWATSLRDEDGCTCGTGETERMARRLTGAAGE